MVGCFGHAKPVNISVGVVVVHLLGQLRWGHAGMDYLESSPCGWRRRRHLLPVLGAVKNGNLLFSGLGIGE